MRKFLSTLMATAICTLVIVGCSKNSDTDTDADTRRKV